MSDTANQELNTYELSDEELLAMDLNALADNEQDNSDADTDTSTEAQTEVDETVAQEQEPSQEQEQEQDLSKDNTGETDDTGQSFDIDSSATDDTDGLLKSDKKVDYEEFHHALTKPFKANGKQIQITDPNDAIRLMQMGANYSKKMQELKPKQALIKTLEANGLDETKLAFAIDLLNKKPEAIAKFVKDNDIDSYEIDENLADDYNPNLQITEPTAFEDTVQELVDTYDGFNDLLSTTMSWDNDSKRAIYNEPNILRAIAEQKQLGIYDTIMAELEKEQLLGRINKPFLEAYVDIESKLLAQQQANQSQTQQKRFVDSRPSGHNDKKDKKRQAVGTAKNPNATQPPFDPLKVSDEELLKYLG